MEEENMDGQCPTEEALKGSEENPYADLNEFADDLRKALKKCGADVMFAKNVYQDTGQSPVKEGEDFGEVLANLTLAYRHIEDAAMRLGKVKQALNGGENIYDKNTVGDPRK